MPPGSGKRRSCKSRERRAGVMAASFNGSWLVLLLIATSFAFGCCVDDKCAACEAVAGELEIGLSNEKPKNHLDMRHRLDSKGQRVGKMIDYRVSELRVVELLDGLCEKMQDYTLEKRDSSKQEWVKVHDWDAYGDNKQEAKAHSKALSSYCGRLLEDTEDDFAEFIRKGSVKVGGVSKVLCQDLSKHCIQKSGFDEEDGLPNEAKDDL